MVPRVSLPGIMMIIFRLKTFSDALSGAGIMKMLRIWNLPMNSLPELRNIK